jgi:hypothetical protein
MDKREQSDGTEIAFTVHVMGSIVPIEMTG